VAACGASSLRAVDNLRVSLALRLCSLHQGPSPTAESRRLTPRRHSRRMEDDALSFHGSMYLPVRGCRGYVGANNRIK
jgi:hypothetical protein